MNGAERIYTLTDDQFQRLLDYFEKSCSAVSDEEIAAVLSLDIPLRDMLRAMNQASRT